MIGIIVTSILLIICISLISYLNYKLECKDIYFKQDEIDEILKFIDKCTTIKQVQDLYSYVFCTCLNKRAKICERCGFFDGKDERVIDDWDFFKKILFDKRKEIEINNKN